MSNGPPQSAHLAASIASNSLANASACLAIAFNLADRLVVSPSTVISNAFAFVVHPSTILLADTVRIVLVSLSQYCTMKL